MNAPIAVLTPVFNDVSGLMRTLTSLKQQDIAFDWVLVDDGSTPPIEIATEDLPFQVRLLRMPKNSGITAALNAGLEYILSGEYQWIARLDAGDEALPGRFQKQQTSLIANDPIGVVGSWVELVDPEGKTLLVRELPVTDQSIRKQHCRSSGMVHSSVMIRAQAIREAGKYDPAYPYAEDFDLWLRILRIAECSNIPEVLLKVEVKPGSISTSKRRTQVKSRVRLLLREFNFFSARAYSGLASNFVLYIIPYSFSLRVKQFLDRSRRWI